MKIVLILFIGISIHVAQAADLKLTCYFPNQTEEMGLENCVEKKKNGDFRFVKSAFAKIKFDSKGLAGGSIAKEGCYWLNSKGLLRKTLCFDNGADSFSEGLTRYIDGKGKFGFMNEKLQVKISPKYDFVSQFQSGQAKACVDCRIEKHSPDSEYSFRKGGQWTIINQKGKITKKCPQATQASECN